MTQQTLDSCAADDGRAKDNLEEFVTMTIDGQLFGVPVLVVQDVLGSQRLTRVPMAAPEIAGVLNLRGRIVTAIDMRRRLGLGDRPAGDLGMSVVVDFEGELYSLIVDGVGEVLGLPVDACERSPSTLDPEWRAVSKGIYRLDEGLLIVLDVASLLNIDRAAAA